MGRRTTCGEHLNDAGRCIVGKPEREVKDNIWHMACPAGRKPSNSKFDSYMLEAPKNLIIP
jgi:hypothetical protein